jgi:hypothetical protein
MSRTIHATAVGAAVICCAVLAIPTRAVAGVSAEPEEMLENDDASPGAIIEHSAGPNFAPDPETVNSFSWTSDTTLAPPPYVIAATESDFVAPSASSTAIPLPPAVWTGFAGLGALGALSYLRRLRLRR